MRTILTLILMLSLATPLAISDAHGDCDSKGTPALGIVEVSPLGAASSDGTGTIYLDDRDYLLGNGLWLYEETNDVFHDLWYGDLQRGGYNPLLWSEETICFDDSPNGPDEMIL